MKLYSICVDGLPVVVLSTRCTPPMSGWADPELLAAARQMQAIVDGLSEESRLIFDQMKIDKALDTYLGEDLRVLRRHGRQLWSGDRASIQTREARFDEAAQWHSSRQRAIDAGESDVGEEDWLFFLVSVSEAED